MTLFRMARRRPPLRRWLAPGLGVLLGWATAVHPGDDLRAARALRAANLGKLEAVVALLPDGPAALFAHQPTALGPLLLDRNLVIAGTGVDRGHDAATPVCASLLGMRRGLVIALLGVAPLGLFAARALPLPRQEPPASASNQPMPSRRQPSHEPAQRGVALGLFAEDVSFSYAPLLGEIAALGASHVALVVPLYQTHAASTRLCLHTRLSPTLEAVADAIREARRAGLEVTLFPIVRLSDPRTPDEWRGTLQPSDADAWFASYGEHLGDLASLANLTGATRLVVGSELSTLDGDLARWQHLITLIRAVFSGTLVYSANWDHYRDARLFELVDEIGVVGYFSLRDAMAPSDVATLATSWRRIGRELDADLSKYDKPFLFTEVGYRSRAGATAAPWDETSGGTPDLAEQQRGFEAFRQAFTLPASSHRRIDGLYIWNWYGYGGPGTTSYTPRGKPAAATVRQILLDLDRP